MSADVSCCETEFFVFILVIIGLVMFAGLMAGLTLGLMSLGLVDLEVLSKSGRPQDRIHACKFTLFVSLYIRARSSLDMLYFKLRVYRNMYTMLPA
ncbi:DUF21 domain-containing protein [Capsicum baccatum]|uniref:DUF21 domain-containing protein n=1 Tax=Capsicum baccatum TaxID=33114 RepID=A0A2G2X120_CAPBA|nr:DUF21 domain-containing protein [Capsicum baccatum]